MSVAGRIVVCLDVQDGRVVKGVNFVDLKDAGDPVECAIAYDHAQADELVFLDITATHEARDNVTDLATACAKALSIPFTIGGGVRSVEDFERLLQAGADKVAINSAAVKRPELIRECSTRFGAQAVVVAVDARRTGDAWNVYVRGGREDTGIDAIEWMQRVEELGAGEIMLTSMDRDGTGEGFDLDLTRRAVEAVRIPVIASGGAGTPEHLAEGLRTGASAVLAAGMFHFGRYDVRDVKRALLDAGVNVRPVE